MGHHLRQKSAGTGPPVSPIGLFWGKFTDPTWGWIYCKPGTKGFTIDNTIEAVNSNAPAIRMSSAGPANPWASC